jgi:hypothetical protein
MKGHKTIGTLSLMMFLLTCAYLSADEQEGTGEMEIITQIFGGYLAGYVGGIGVGIVVSELYMYGYHYDPGAPEVSLMYSFTGFTLGATPAIILASSASVYGIGQAWENRRSGSFWKTLLGASVPPLLGAIVGGTYELVSVEPGAQDIPLICLWGAFFGSFLSPVGAITGYQLSVQPKKPAAIPFEGHSSSRLENGDRTVIVPLLQIRF